jgi:hypothetical protein
MNKLIEMARANMSSIEFNYKKIASLASNGMPLKKAFQRVYPGADVPSASTIRKRMESETNASSRKRNFKRESYLKSSKPSLFESEEEAIEFARKQSPRRAHNAAMREKFGPEWYKVKSRKYKRPPSNKKATRSPKPSAKKKVKAKPSAMSKVGGFMKGRYGYGAIGGLGGLAVGGVIGRSMREKKD